MRTTKYLATLAVAFTGLTVVEAPLRAQAPAPFAPPAVETIMLKAFESLRDAQLPPPPDRGGRLPPPPDQGRRLPPPPDQRRQRPPRRDRGDRYRGRDEAPLRAFRNAERDFQRADAEYRSAPSGSWQEQRADRDRREASSRGLAAIREIGRYRVDPEQLESLASECDSKYRSASSGSLLEQFYEQARTAAWRAAEDAWRDEFNEERNWEDTVRFAERFDAAYRNASSGSGLEAHYNRLREAAWTAALSALDDEFSYSSDDFRSIERIALRMDAEYRSAASGSRRESFYDQARRRSFQAAETAFGRFASRADRYELRRIQDEYDAKYRSAGSGSALEGYYRRIRDSARY